MRCVFPFLVMLLAGCKIITTAGPGGSIVSQSGTYDCPEATTCEIDIDDGTDFADSFQAVPRDGYNFAGWKKADLHLCGGSAGQCDLSVPGLLTAYDVTALMVAEFRFQSELVSAGEYELLWAAWSAPLDFIEISQIVATDLNGDGHEDLVIAAGTWLWETFEGGRYGVILFNNGDFTYTPAGGDRPFSAHPREMGFADFDGNGLLDIFIGDHGWDAPPYPGFDNQLLLQTEPGVFRDATDQLPPDPTGFTHNIGVGDIDNDGDVDLVIGNHGGDGNQYPYILINDGQASFTRSRERLPQQLRENWRTYPWGLELADIDGDGFVDLLAGANQDGDGVSRLYWGQEDGYFTEEVVTLLPLPGFWETWGKAEVIAFLIEDFDQDGQTDLLIGAYDSGSTSGFPRRGAQVLMNEGKRRFNDQTSRRLGEDAVSLVEGWHERYRYLDYNGDGTPDIVPGSYDTERGNIVAWLNDGTGHFTALHTNDIDNADVVFRLPRTLVRGVDGFQVSEIYMYEGELGINGVVVAQPPTILLPD